MSRTRRVSFTPITLPRSPEVRASLRSFNAAHIRDLRNQNRDPEPELCLTASDALRQRKLRASRLVKKVLLACSINTLQHRSSRASRLYQSRVLLDQL